MIPEALCERSADRIDLICRKREPLWIARELSFAVLETKRDLSRDHVIPVFMGGIDRWMNVVTACRVCNIRKGGRTPEGASMPLLYAPYVPNRYEHLILQNRRILQDQMEYLMAKVPKHSRLHA